MNFVYKIRGIKRSDHRDSTDHNKIAKIFGFLFKNGFSFIRQNKLNGSLNTTARILLYIQNGRLRGYSRAFTVVRKCSVTDYWTNTSMIAMTFTKRIASDLFILQRTALSMIAVSVRIASKQSRIRRISTLQMMPKRTA